MTISYNKIKFFSSYFFYKVFMFREIKKGKKGLYAAELIWVLSKLGILTNTAKSYNYLWYVETKFGKFHINPDLLTNIAASPAYERLDLNFLVKNIKKDIERSHSVLFIDVGAYFGLYTIAVENSLKMRKKIHYVLFEPGTEYLSKPTLDLLHKNLNINHVKNATVYPVGLGEKKISKASHHGIPTIKLDSLIPIIRPEEYDKIYIKIDVDGYEKKVLSGATKFLSKARDVSMVIEDFVDPRIVKTLTTEFEFVAKLTPYNSFWNKKSLEKHSIQHTKKVKK